MPFLLALVACTAVEPAPAELDDPLHWIWQRYDEGSDQELAEGIRNLDAAVDGGAIDEAFDGSVSRLTADEAALVGVTDRDPALAPGVFLVNAFECAFGQLEEILSYQQQEELYDNVYDSYTRQFDTPRGEWLGAPDGTLTYDILYAASLLGASYDAESEGALRRVPDLGEDGLPWGRFIAQRSYMPERAAFEEGSNKTLDQDYQLELYWPRGGDRVVHVYGMWRQADFGGGFDMEDEGSQRLLLNSLLDWDDNTAELCAEGRP